MPTSVDSQTTHLRATFLNTTNIHNPLRANKMVHQSLDTRQAHQERTQQESATSSATPQPTASRTTGSAKNYNAPPEQPGSDLSAKKPVFTRGPSVMDYTAVTSAAPTPAGEISNPMALNIVKGESRQREPHLPDLDII